MCYDGWKAGASGTADRVIVILQTHFCCQFIQERISS